MRVDQYSPAEFFYVHAGYSYDPLRQTREAGRVECARALAMAEQWACGAGIFYEWEVDDDAIYAESLERGEPIECRLWRCVAKSCEGDLLTSLGAIDFAIGDDPWHGDPYKRVVEAELALELLSDDGSSSPLDFMRIRPEIIRDNPRN